MTAVIYVITNLTVGIMVCRRKHRKSVLKIYSRYNNLDVNLISFSLDDIDWKKKKIHALHMKRDVVKEDFVPLPQVIYNRCYFVREKIIHRLEKMIGENKIYNRITRLNKWHVYRILESSTRLKEYLPYTCLYDEEQLQKSFQNNKVMYLKPCLGHKGKGVYRLEVLNDQLKVSQDSLPPRYTWRFDDKLLSKKVSQLLNGKQYILQNGVSLTQIDERHFDLRVLVQKNVSGDWEITNIVSREAYKQYYNTSICEKVHFAEDALKFLFPINEIKIILDKLLNISKDTATILDKELGTLAELSIDFGIDVNGGLWIIEVNGKPQKSLYRDLLDIQERSTVYRKPLEYALFLYESSI
jgi:hypothetical protein